jgi:hypothetical protein
MEKQNYLRKVDIVAHIAKSLFGHKTPPQVDKDKTAENPRQPTSFAKIKHRNDNVHFSSQTGKQQPII